MSKHQRLTLSVCVAVLSELLQPGPSSPIESVQRAGFICANAFFPLLNQQRWNTELHSNRHAAASDTIVTFCVRCSRAEMYIGHGRLCVCLSLDAFPHYCTDPDVSWGNGMIGCPLVVHYWADLQSVHGFRWYDNIALNANASLCLYTLNARFVLYKLYKHTHVHVHACTFHFYRPL